MVYLRRVFFFFFKQKTAYELRISDWSSDVCSSDLVRGAAECARNVARQHRIFAASVRLGGQRDSAAASRQRAANFLGDQIGDRPEHDLRRILRRPDDTARAQRRERGVVDRRQIGRASWRESVCQYV